MADGFFDKRWIIVECTTWFSRHDKTTAGMKAVDFWLATIETNGDAKVFRGIATEHLAKEREMVQRHNEELASLGKPPKSPGPSKAEADTARAIAAGKRKPPKDAALFEGKANG
jgi:hypothetical protein